MAVVGVLREAEAESRVALTPDAAGRLRERGVQVLVESGAGDRAWFADADYRTAGARVGPRQQVRADSDIVVCVRPPADLDAGRAGQVLAGLLFPLADPPVARRLAGAGVTALSLDLLPRTLSRAQSMDALTSQATVAGYRAALLAAEAYPGFFPLLMTAAGTIRPARVLVLGAGVAGLQAIATARRLGAVVTGYDVRPAARDDIASTGATVLAVDAPAATAAGGYARALTGDEQARQQAALDRAVGGFDVVITTAQVPGGRPPRLVTGAALAGMRPGSVVLDLAAGPDGGNVAGSVPGARIRTQGGVTVIGAPDLPAGAPVAASTGYARNLLALLDLLITDGAVVVDATDEILAAITVTHAGRVVHPGVAAALAGLEEVPS